MGLSFFFMCLRTFCSLKKPITDFALNQQIRFPNSPQRFRNSAAASGLE